MDVSGGTGMFRGNELERLFRDARCGRFHPANTFLTHEIVAKTALGIDLGEQPRWGSSQISIHPRRYRHKKIAGRPASRNLGWSFLQSIIPCTADLSREG